MKFLVDAQLPRRLAKWLTGQGHDAIHTLDLPSKNATTDTEVLARAVDEARTVITKDDDFVQSFLVSGEPPSLLLVSTGNISNTKLEALFQENLVGIVAALRSARFVELSREGLTLRA